MGRPIWLLLTGLLAPLALGNTDKAGEILLDQISRLKAPVWSGDPKNAEAFRKQTIAYRQKRNDLILELSHHDPKNSKLPALLKDRWMHLADPQLNNPNAAITRIQTDIEQVERRNPSPAIREAADYCLAYLRIDAEGDPRHSPVIANAFAAKYPRTEDAAEILYRAAFLEPFSEKIKLYHRVAREYPRFKWMKEMQREFDLEARIGKPFSLSFKDAISGRPIDLAKLKGRVIVIDFWATWCQDCVAEMSQIKNLYDRYHPKGVDLIGVSLDMPEKQAGLIQLKTYVETNHLPWPQYYQGNGWDSSYSKGLGIMDLPTQFLIDKHGKLRLIGSATSPNFVPLVEKLIAEK